VSPLPSPLALVQRVIVTCLYGLLVSLVIISLHVYPIVSGRQ
jgi:hypothetical protein